MGLNLFKLEKLQIVSYTKDTRNLSEIKDTFEVMFNPESISVSHGNNFSEQDLINITNQAQFTGQVADRLSVNLVVDGTGVNDFGAVKLLGMGTKSVSEQIKEFLKVCYNIEGKIHEPRFLKIKWGDDGVLRDFSCRLESVDIEYSLFHRSGSPLHAVLKANFIEDLPPDKAALQNNLQSPDVSHSRVVKSGDTLPLLSKEIYGSSQYYLRIAQVNNIDDFRNLSPGRELIFPPLDIQHR